MGDSPSSVTACGGGAFPRQGGRLGYALRTKGCVDCVKTNFSRAGPDSRSRFLHADSIRPPNAGQYAFSAGVQPGGRLDCRYTDWRNGSGGREYLLSADGVFHRHCLRPEHGNFHLLLPAAGRERYLPCQVRDYNFVFLWSLFLSSSWLWES